jgi:hypothetical protein
MMKTEPTFLEMATTEELWTEIAHRCISSVLLTVMENKTGQRDALCRFKGTQFETLGLLQYGNMLVTQGLLGHVSFIPGET